MATIIGEFTVEVEDISDRKGFSLVSAGSVEIEDGRVVNIRLAPQHLEFWIRHGGKPRYYRVALETITTEAVALIVAQLGLEREGKADA